MKKASKLTEAGGKVPAVEAGLMGDGPVGGRILLKEAENRIIFLLRFGSCLLSGGMWVLTTDGQRCQNVEQDNRIPIIISADQTSTTTLVGSWKKAVEVAACVLSRRNL